MTYQKRRRKIIDRPLQLRLVGSFLAVACLAALFQVILLNNSMLGLAREMQELGDEVLSHTPKLLARNVALTLGVLIPCVLVVGILVTHRIAGPTYRFRMYLNEIAENGAPERPCRIRRNDELHDICALLNRAVDALATGHTTTDGSEDEADRNPESGEEREAA